jgi:tetratricopeptide (TPR) repeat protein
MIGRAGGHPIAGFGYRQIIGFAATGFVLTVASKAGGGRKKGLLQMAGFVEFIDIAMAWTSHAAAGVIGWASDAITKFVIWIGDSGNRNLVTAIAGLATGAFAVFQFIRRKDVGASIAKQNEMLVEQRNKLDEITISLMSKAPAAPDRERAVFDAVAAAQEGAAAGDKRLQSALALLETSQVAEAEALFQAVADDKAERIAREEMLFLQQTVRIALQAEHIKQDREDAAAAYRNLGAIAGLRDPRKALDAYQRALDYDPDDRKSLYWAGYLLIQRGKLDEAQARFGRVLSNSRPTSSYRFWALIGLGDIHFAKGDLHGAMLSFLNGNEIVQELVQSAPDDAGWQRGLSVAHIKTGDVQVAQDDSAEALKSFRDCLAIRESLVRAAPDNPGRRRDLSVVYLRIGDVQLSQGDLKGALKSFSDGFAIRQALVRSDAGNAGWQFDLGINHERIGDVRKAQGDAAAALASYEAARNIILPLAQSDRGNASWQRALSVSHKKIGEMLKARGQLMDALTSFRDALAISEQLAQSQRGNAVWQVDLVDSHWKLAESGDDAHRRWALIVATLRKLKAENRLAPVHGKLLPDAEVELAKYTGGGGGAVETG